MAVTAAAGVLVGVLRRFLRVPAKLPGTVKELEGPAGRALYGPEGGCCLAGVAGRWGEPRARGRAGEDGRRAGNLGLGAAKAQRGGARDEHAQRDVRSVRRPVVISDSGDDSRPRDCASEGQRAADTLVGGLLSASVAFAVYFPIAGSTFVGIYTLPSFKYEDWQLLAAVPLGLVAGALALITVVAIGLVTKLTAPLAKRTILRSTLGGIAFGLVGVALPLTLFTGTDQLTTVIHDGAALGAGLLIAVVFAKILVFALCEATGFIGGPFLVMLFIGGTAGIAAHVLIPGLPEGLAFTAMFAALPGGARRRPVLADPAGRPHDPDRHPADRAGRDRRPHRATSPSRARACSCAWRTAHASPTPRRQRPRQPHETDTATRRYRAPRKLFRSSGCGGASIWGCCRDRGRRSGWDLRRGHRRTWPASLRSTPGSAPPPWSGSPSACCDHRPVAELGCVQILDRHRDSLQRLACYRRPLRRSISRRISRSVIGLRPNVFHASIPRISPRPRTG